MTLCVCVCVCRLVVTKLRSDLQSSRDQCSAERASLALLNVKLSDTREQLSNALQAEREGERTQAMLVAARVELEHTQTTLQDTESQVRVCVCLCVCRSALQSMQTGDSV